MVELLLAINSYTFTTTCCFISFRKLHISIWWMHVANFLLTESTEEKSGTRIQEPSWCQRSKERLDSLWLVHLGSNEIMYNYMGMGAKGRRLWSKVTFVRAIKLNKWFFRWKNINLENFRWKRQEKNWSKILDWWVCFFGIVTTLATGVKQGDELWQNSDLLLGIISVFRHHWYSIRAQGQDREDQIRKYSRKGRVRLIAS